MKDYTVKITSNAQIARGIYEMTLSPISGKFEPMRCGQFLHLSIPNSALLLRRPFCLYKFSDTSVSVAYAVIGKGTEEMSRLSVGTELKVTLPLGNGFYLGEEHKNVVLLGGGMGCAPLAYVPKTYPDKKYYAFLGFADKSRVAFEREFSANADTTVCTDDGSYGIKGYPTAALEKRLSEIKPDVILVCGPTPMMKGVKQFAAKYGIPAYASMEERMGCGVGACLVCACKIKQGDGYAMRRVCADGPVFKLENIEL